MSQKRWIVEIAFTDPWRGKPADSDWLPDKHGDPLATISGRLVIRL